MHRLASNTALFAAAMLLGAACIPAHAQQAWPGSRAMMGGGMMGGGMMGGPYGGGYGRYGNGPVPPGGNSHGAQLVQRYCTQCHGLPNPRQHAAREWPQVVTQMERFMAARGFPVPGEADTKAIVDYLQQYSADASR